MTHKKDSDDFAIVTVGSGNIEYILEHKGEIIPGQKHIVKAHEFFGGSCLNYTFRLMAAGYDVFPMPLVGDDPSGQKIRKALLEYARPEALSKTIQTFVAADDFLLPALETPQTTVVVHAGRRTIFSPELGAAREATQSLMQRFDKVADATGSGRMAVMIGHILLNGDASNPGEVTQKIIERFYRQHLIFVNFGRSQYRHGIEFWEKALKNVDLLQLNLGEIRHLFRDTKNPVTLSGVIDWLKAHAITAVITLKQLGAIGTFGDGSDGLVFARPLNIPAVVDPTGAGDAFAAGMVASLKCQKNFGFQDFKAGMTQGRLWASYACTKIGASTDCPDLKTLAAFEKACAAPGGEVLHITDDQYAHEIMNFIDEAY
jgi:sugar/nucleoside kinase (ribokinase family)